VIGAGFTGLAAAYELARQGIRPTVLEADNVVGGLAGSFAFGGTQLEKFYHHWFTSDRHVIDLIRELGTEDRVVYRPTRTGMYYANNFFKLSTPLDVLRFSALSLPNRVRLGLLVVRARTVRDWRSLESITVAEWLSQLGSSEIYRVVWEPLLRGKFGSYAPEVAAVWLWNKLKLRAGSRNSRGSEVLAYYRGGFAALAERIAAEIAALRGTVKTGVSVTGLMVEHGQVRGVRTTAGEIAADAVIATPALPIVASLLETHVPDSFVSDLRRIRYLANMCLVLELDRSLSETYWLNVADPNFPFVGIIEHTNFEPAQTYGGRHIVYLSKYLEVSDPLYRLEDREVKEYSLSHLKRMFPRFDDGWIRAYHVWRASYAQPIISRGYRDLIPASETPLEGFFIASMAQIYPEDRGTNYAVREGRRIAHTVSQHLRRSEE